jgi:hypothetical protein
MAGKQSTRRNVWKINIRELTNYMDVNNSWEATSCAAPQEFPEVLWNPKANCRIHKSPPLVPILNQINPVHIRKSYVFKIHYNIV